MSSVEKAARLVKSLKDEEWRTLAGLEKAASGYGTADYGRLSRMSRLPVERVRFAADALVRKELIERKGAGFSLAKEGVELMALKEYVKKDLVYALGAIIAKGKESDVYEAVNEEGSLFALKFFKLGRTSFTRVRKKRFMEEAKIRTWITVNYEAARREHSALNRLRGLGNTFPRAYGHNRSTVLLEHLSGIRLSERPELVDPEKSLEDVISSVRKAFMKAGLVNADLSEYNVLTDGARVWLIDWPQAVGSDHPNCKELLRHDVETVVKFFRKAYGTGISEGTAYSYAAGEASRLE
ncbi:MAG: hypothetical protein HY296_03465 [Thaumarchaeota archaeon]|nr:hypothetical protein [Nitrososphaerota archaeon]